MTPAGPLIVTATFGAVDHGWLQGLRNAHFPPERNQVPVHLTLFHQLPPSIDGELRQRLGDFARLPPPRALITGVVDLGGAPLSASPARSWRRCAPNSPPRSGRC